jgi:hypothetical protein
MTTPGARQAQQNYQQQVQHNSTTFARNAAYHGQQLRYRRQHPRGPVGPIRRLIGFVFSLVFIAIAVGIFLVILSAAQPDWFNHVKTWFDSIF